MYKTPKTETSSTCTNNEVLCITFASRTGKTHLNRN